MNYGLSAYETKKLEKPAVPKMSASVIDGVYDWTKQTKSQVKLICPDAPDKYQVLAKDGEKIEIQIRARKELASVSYTHLPRLYRFILHRDAGSSNGSKSRYSHCI